MQLHPIEDLTATTCAWPIGDPQDWDTFRYCCEPVRFDELGFAHRYCQAHFELSTTPLSRIRVSVEKARIVGAAA